VIIATFIVPAAELAAPVSAALAALVDAVVSAADDEPDAALDDPPPQPASRPTAIAAAILIANIRFFITPPL